MNKLNIQEIKTSFVRDGFAKANGLFDDGLVDKLLKILNDSENIKKAEGVIFDNIGEKNIKYNRNNTIKEGLTGNFSKAQHSS